MSNGTYKCAIQINFVLFGVNNSHSVPVLLSIVMTEGWYLHPAPLRHGQLLGGR